MFRRSLIGLVTVFLLATTASSTMAAKGWDEHPGSDFRLGADFPINIPVGNVSNTTGVGVGLFLLDLAWHPIDMLAVTLRPGVIFHIPKSVGGGFFGGSTDITVWEIPILWPGVQVYVWDGLYLGFEMGLNYVTASVSNGPSSDSVEFGSSFSVGFELGDIDFRAGAWISSWDAADDGIALFFSAGYNFLYF